MATIRYANCGPSRSPALPMAIDHVLVSRSIAVLDVRTHDIEGTDHRMLVADLRLPAG